MNFNLEVKSARTRSAPSKKSSKTRSAPSKRRSIPNLDQINKNVPRTVCLDQLPTKLKPHLRGLLTIATPKHIGYTQGDNFVALTLLHMSNLNLHSIHDAYEIFASQGMRRFRMLTPQNRVNFVGEVAPYFNIVTSQQLIYIMLTFSHFFYGGGPHKSNCSPKLLMTLLNHTVDFFKHKDRFVQFYLFMLKHLSISAVDDLLMNGERNMSRSTSVQTYIDHIEDLTLNSINNMSINSRNTLSVYFNQNNHKYKCHIIAAYAVMLLDKVLGVSSNINTETSILQEINYAKGLIHNSSISDGMPNLQGIRPILQEVNINFKTNIPWMVMKYARMFKGVLPKLILAQYVLELPPVSITSKSSVGKHLMTIWYVDKKREMWLRCMTQLKTVAKGK